jgi:hypothetical protein
MGYAVWVAVLYAPKVLRCAASTPPLLFVWQHHRDGGSWVVKIQGTALSY